MIINKGEKIHIIYRRLLESESRRHFVGEVLEVSDSVVRIQGKAFILDSSKNQYIRKPETRTTIIDLAESGYIVNIIPNTVSVTNLRYELNKDKNLVVTDGLAFSLDINEFGFQR